MRCGLVFILLFGMSIANAEIYTWVDPSGVRHYSDSAANSKAEKAHLPGLQGADGDPDALARLQAMAASDAQKPADSRTPKLTEPRAGQSFRSANATVPVAVTVGGASGLRSGEKITYYLDGSPIPQSPTDQTRLQLGNVPRGAHTLSAALLYQGREIRRTAPITFYMKPPSAISPVNSGPDNGGDNTNTTPGATTAPAAGNPGGAPAAPRTAGSGAPPG